MNTSPPLSEKHYYVDFDPDCKPSRFGPKLKGLCLTFKNLRYVPAHVWEMKEIQWLELCNNYLDTISPDIAKLCNLSAVDISRNPFKKFPDAVCLLHALKELCACACNLTALPSSFVSIIQLDHLRLDANEFEVFPEVICECKNLRYLSMANNKLAELPRSFAKLQNLFVLYLGDNKFKTFPKVVCEIEGLCRLALCDNQLTELPLAMTKLLNLTVLSLGGNDLPSIPLLLGDLPRLGYILILGQRIFHRASRYLDETYDVIGYLQQRKEIPRLSVIIASGFFCDQTTPWARFLFQGVYDPRLFIFIFEFAMLEETAQKKLRLE